MTEFRTLVKMPTFKNRLKVESKSLFMGSCFTENVGAKMQASKFNVTINPFGIIYNPSSLAQCFDFLLGKQFFVEDDLIESETVYHSFYHHSRFSNTNKAILLSSLNDSLTKSREDFKNAEFIFITFGTAWVYEFKPTGKVVSNCHKLPAKDFNRYKLSLSEITEKYKTLIHDIGILNPDAQIIFTVSPVRHFKDGAVENQLSKSTLLLAINNLVEEFNQVHYFPAYEIMMDDLRDYRFYNSDMLHPSAVAIDYIWEGFKEALIDRSSDDFIQKVERISKAMQHRPFQPQAESHQKFVKKQLSEIEGLNSKYPQVDFAKEIEYFKSVLV